MEKSIISAVLEAERQAEAVVADAQAEGEKMRKVAAEEADVLETTAAQQVAQRLKQTKESLAAETAAAQTALEERKLQVVEAIRREAAPKRAEAVEAVQNFWK